MTRKTVVLAIAALMVVGTSAALAVGSGPAATDEAPLAQETETTTAANETVETTADETTMEETTMQETTTAEGQVGAESARITFLNQTAGYTFTNGEPNTTSVLIERVVVPEGGFLVVHQAQNATGEYATEGQVEVGSVVGNSTYLEPGVHSNVVVELNGTVNNSQTLVAMAHQDTNDNRQYEFPEADGPYTQNGSAVIDTGYVIIEYDATDLTFGDDGNQTTTEA
ncbi:hypothetical protein M0R88_17120 [Halorussus gelatinilyticus]|uniref:DUF7282 domain-containing protein n=1 Tax=Halorussus gelatinilyticus TaxID=2937524 RepID=A0A8U0IHS1_9EURY|nr:hypothetical protein [Halorussus gelatinilyticus]UPW00221.1 hypothetical protein M0R88_17120 [Halorussus gelatinilyticus]